MAHAEIAGKARIIDGDTIDIAGQRIRLHGMDAPETKQTCVAKGKRWPCGEYAGFAIAEMIGKNWVHCRERDRDRYGRIVADCNLAGLEGPNVNEWMVSDGSRPLTVPCKGLNPKYARIGTRGVIFSAGPCFQHGPPGQVSAWRDW